MEISRLLDGPASEESNSPNDASKAQSLKTAASTEIVVKQGAQSLARPASLIKRKRRRRLSAKQLRVKNQRETDNSLILNLTLDVNDLRQQVHNCIVQRSIRETQLLVARQQFHARSLQSVDHFFQLFRHGYPCILTTTETRYLQGLLDENIAVGGGVRGQEAFYEQWRRYKQLFNVRRLSNFSTRVVTSDAGGCLVECSGEFEGCVTAAALETVFPHIVEDAALVRRVLRRRFVCPTRTLISFDSSGCLVQYDAYSDVFEAMSELLDFDPFRVARLMENAVISEGSLLPPVDDCISEDDGGAGGYAQQEGSVGRASPVSSTTSSRASIEFILS